MTALSVSKCKPSVEGWPDWSGQTAVIVGTGPSAADAPLGLVQGKAKVFVIKGAWRLAPWADALYGIDIGWWFASQGARKFQGLKFSPSPSVCRAYGVRQVVTKPRAEILTKETGVVGCGLRQGGGHSGFQALNLAIQWGSRRCLLVGWDMTLANGAHFSDERGVGKPDAKRVEGWRDAMDACAPQFERLGVEVVNCSMDSALRNYPKIPLEEAVHASHKRLGHQSEAGRRVEGGSRL